jgi:hemerythrin-like domain-containing protein
MFDATDLRYQVSDKFKPDKESTWTFPMNNDGWMHAHDSIRGEMKDIQQMLIAIKERKVPLKDWEVKALTCVFSAHFIHIHAHHSNEEIFVMPELQKRIKIPDKLEDDHVELMKKINELESIMNSIKVNDFLDDSMLVQKFSEYHSTMLLHLKEEEFVCLPLMRAYFTHKEMTQVIQKFMPKSPKVETGSFVYYYIGQTKNDVGPYGIRNDFCPQEGIPSFVWYIDFQPKYKYFVKEFINNVHALQTGIEPKQSTPWYCRLFGW